MRTPIQRLHLSRGLFVRALVLGALVVGALIVPLLAGPQRAFAAGSVSDNFNRANGTLGAGWTDMSDGGLAISSQAVVGTKSTYSGDIRTGETYPSDQSSQIATTSTQLSGGQWIGAAVRAQSGGQSLYLGLYFWNNGNPEARCSTSGSAAPGPSSAAPRCQPALAAGTLFDPRRSRFEASAFLTKRCRSDHGHRHRPLDRGRPRHHGLRHSHS